MSTLTADDFLLLSAIENRGLSILEQLDANSCKTRNRPQMIGHNSKLKLSIVFRPACKLWSCPVCSETNKLKWALRTRLGIEFIQGQGRTVYFATITTHEKIKTASQAQNVFKSAWPALRHRLGRKSPKMAFLGVPEHVLDDRFHFHFLCDATITERWLKDNARQCGFGYIADYEELLSASRGGSYTIKYLGKQLAGRAFPKYFRRVRTSQNWYKLPELPKNPDWIFRLVPKHRQIDDVIFELEGVSRSVIMTDHATAWSVVDHAAILMSHQTDDSPFIDTENKPC